MNHPKVDPEASMAVSLVAKLHRQAAGLREEVKQLRLDLAQAKMDFSESMDGRLGIITEITQVKLAEVAQQKLTLLEQENRQMLETDQLKNLFMSHMTHELRTPLNAIIGFTDLLHMRAVPVGSPKQQEFLGHIGNSARHLLHLINDVLDLSKVEAGKFPFHPEPVDLRQLIAELGGVLHSAFERHGISFEVDVGADFPEIVIDPTRLKQVLYNYLSNALKFTPAGGRVMVRARPEGGACSGWRWRTLVWGLRPRIGLGCSWISNSSTRDPPSFTKARASVWR
jgi:signal transduction histidine kinase